MWRERLKSRDWWLALALALILAGVWLLVAFLVAYPQHFLGGRWLIADVDVSREFFGTGWKERFAIPFLIGVDIGIDLMLDRKHRPILPVWVVVSSLVAIFIYAVLAGWVPMSNPLMASEHGDPHMGYGDYRTLFWVAFSMLLIPRFLSFIRPIQMAGFGKNFDVPAPK